MKEAEGKFNIDLYLIAEGLQQCRRSYRDNNSEVSYNYYMSASIDKISEIWSYLNEDIKVDYIKKNMDETFRFIRELKSNGAK